MKTLRNALFMLGRVAKYTPAFFFWTIVEGLVWGCIHSFTSVLFIKSLFDMIGAGSPSPMFWFWWVGWPPSLSWPICFMNGIGSLSSPRPGKPFMNGCRPICSKGREPGSGRL